ncbi:MAG TPA: undecaprenyl-diphosphate phosphatase [Candidatus Didemnitutus sp.]|nr:undecaprenyl-diphosphate phosphatase [Candidatus Didemnitutus sp.]
MPIRPLPLLLGLLILGWTRLAAAQETLAPAKPTGPVAELSVTDAVVLGVVEGVTEYLPVSSTGHLIIACKFLGLESDKPLQDASGQPLWYRKPGPKHPDGEPLTVKLAADTYTVIIQVGAIAAVVLLYWPHLVNMLMGLLGRSRPGLLLLRNVILAVLPAGVIGFLAADWINDHLFSEKVVIAAQVLGAGLMFWAEHWRKKNSSVGSNRNEPTQLTPPKALGIGFAQCVAMWPGMSRSMVTIVGGYLAGLPPVRAAEFSFLVGLPTLSGAALLKGLKTGPAMIQVFGWGNMLLGCLVAAVCAAIAVKFLVALLSRHGLAAFAWYRLVMAGVLAIVFLT